MIIPCISTTLESSLLGKCRLTLDTCDVHFDLIINDEYLSLDDICKYENELNANQSKTFYYNTHRHNDHDFREYYEW